MKALLKHARIKILKGRCTKIWKLIEPLRQ